MNTSAGTAIRLIRKLELENWAENKNAEAHFKKPCSYKMRSVYWRLVMAGLIVRPL